MVRRKRVILITDGDLSAWRTARQACAELGLGVVDVTAGAPTNAGIVAIEEAIANSAEEVVVVLADDAGRRGMGEGESLIAMLASSPVAEVVAAVAVASRTENDGSVRVDEAVTYRGKVVAVAVDKEGRPLRGTRLSGDTIGALAAVGVPIVGIGDLGEGGGRCGVATLKVALVEALRLAGVRLLDAAKVSATRRRAAKA